MSRTGLALALAVLAGGGLAVLHGCNSTQDCCGGCLGDDPAVFHLSCSSGDVTSVLATGPCGTDASLSSFLGSGSVFVHSRSAGVCHVELTFATGFTYATDVTFTSQPGGVCGGPQCRCPAHVAPASGPFTVNNPSNTCVAAPDAGADEGGSSGAGMDTGAAHASYPSCTNNGCGTGLACAYPIAAGCSAAGVCVPLTPCGGCGNQPTYCGCAGSGVLQSGDIPAGYSLSAVQGAYYPCAGPDAGGGHVTADAGDAVAE